MVIMPAEYRSRVTGKSRKSNFSVCLHEAPADNAGMDWNALQTEQMREALARFDPADTANREGGAVEACGFREAGVLAPLLREAGEWKLLFIRRSVYEGDRHSGQVAFAGGKREPGDRDIRATALREAEEELGIQPQQLELLGSLPAWYSSTGYCITAQVARLQWPCELRLQAREVDRVFSIPLSWLADRNHFQVMPHRREDGRVVQVVRYRPWQDEILWGATAGMVRMLIQAFSTTG